MPLASRTGEVKYRIKGTPGADAYNLITTVSQVYQTATGTFNPNSFTAYAYQGKELAIGMYLQCWGSSDNENWTYISYRQITYSNTGLTVNVSRTYKYYIVRLYDHNPSTNIDAEPNFLASATVPVIKDGEPGAQGNPGAKMRMRTWASGTYYMRGVGTEEWYDVVEYESRLYLCRVSHTSSSSNSPATDTGYWEAAQNWTFIATKLLLAEKIKANMINADGITAKDVNLTGKITATSGKVGGWTISGNNLECIGSDAQIYIGDTRAGYMIINDSDTIMCRIRTDDGTGLHISTFGENNSAIGLSVLCNASGYGYAIHSTGNTLLRARDDEKILINGLAINVVRVNTSSYRVLTSDDYINVVTATTLTMPSLTSYKGKIYYIRISSTTAPTPTVKITAALLRSFRAANGAIVDYIQFNDLKPRILISDGSYWNEYISST